MKGQPGTFRCASCRSTLSTRPWPAGAASRVRLTGRSKPNQSRGHGGKMMDVALEYECDDCGHVGWSTHPNLATRARCSCWPNGAVRCQLHTLP